MNLKFVSKPLPKSIVAAALCATASAALAGNTALNFSVDMSSQIGAGTFTPGVNHVEAHGTFNGWSALQLTNDPASLNPALSTGRAVDTADDNGAKMQYKYVIDGNTWENPATGNNRVVLLPSTSGASLSLPTVFFGDAGIPVTSSVTFRVDMAQQINLGAFDTNTQTVYVRGMLNGWG